MSLAIKRIISDIKSFLELSYDDKFIYFDKSNFMNIYLMIVGPKNTPYEDGFLFFHLEFNDKYPFESPKVQFLNQDNRIRIHPNLYTNGKVCLSILGTWEGPPWKPTMSLNTVALTIQSILNENPLNNEPAYYNKDIKYSACKDYLVFCLHSKYKLLINDVIENKFRVSKHFKKEINDIYSKNKENLTNNLLSYKIIYEDYKFTKRPYYNMPNNVDFNNIDLKEVDLN